MVFLRYMYLGGYVCCNIVTTTENCWLQTHRTVMSICPDPISICGTLDYPRDLAASIRIVRSLIHAFYHLLKMPDAWSD